MSEAVGPTRSLLRRLRRGAEQRADPTHETPARPDGLEDLALTASPPIALRGERSSHHLNAALRPRDRLPSVGDRYVVRLVLGPRLHGKQPRQLLRDTDTVRAGVAQEVEHLVVTGGGSRRPTRSR